jgi:hypothetical protein
VPASVSSSAASAHPWSPSQPYHLYVKAKNNQPQTRQAEGFCASPRLVRVAARLMHCRSHLAAATLRPGPEMPRQSKIVKRSSMRSRTRCANDRGAVHAMFFDFGAARAARGEESPVVCGFSAAEARRLRSAASDRTCPAESATPRAQEPARTDEEDWTNLSTAARSTLRARVAHRSGSRRTSGRPACAWCA